MSTTKRSVTMAVALFIHRCQVSEKPRAGPLATHTKIRVTVARNACGDPAKSDVLTATLRN